MKKFLTILIAIVLLSSCTNTSKKTVKSSSLVNFSWLNFNIDIPNNWNNYEDKEDQKLPKPKFWEIVLASASTSLKNWFSNNILILNEKLEKSLKSLDYSISDNVWASKNYKQYTLLSSKNIEFADKDKSQLYIFEAKYNEYTPLVKFLQVWKVCDKKDAFLITIALDVNEKNTSPYEEIIKTFNCWAKLIKEETTTKK